MPSKIEISHRTIFFTVAFLAFIWLILQIRDILFLLFISFIIMSVLRPFVEFFEKYKIPRALSILFLYIVVFGFFGVSLGSMFPALISQTTKFISDLPRYVNLLNPYLQIDIKSITSQLAPIGENLVKVTVEVFSNIVTLLMVLIFTFYLLLERKYIEQHLGNLLDIKTSRKIIEMLEAVEISLGSWLRGQLLLMGIISFLTYFGLLFLRIDFALPLAIIAGLFEIIPVVGPIISAVPAVLVAFTVSPFLGLAVAALYFIIQQLENHLLVPIVMNRTVGLPPLIVIVSLMIGSRLAGIAGAILSIPIMVMARALITVYFKDKKPEKSKL